MAERGRDGRFAKGHKRVGGDNTGKKYQKPLSEEIRVRAENFTLSNFPKFMRCMDELDSMEFVRQYIALMKMLLPKDNADDGGATIITIEDRLKVAAAKMTLQK